MPAENNTLTGFILSKATQSRKAAKKKDKSKKKKSKKDTPQQSTNLLTGALSSVTNLFKPDKGKAEEVESKQPRTSGGATGLAKILTEGFGSLTADTLGLAGGLAAITNILNQQLQAQSFTATGVQAITSILSDQLENQSSIVSGVKSLRPGGGVGKAPRAAGVGGGGSKGGGGTEGRTLTEALLQRAGDLGLGAAAARMATNPYGIAALIALAGSAMRIREVERMKPFVEETQTQIQEENKKKDTPWYKKLGNLFAGQTLSSPQGPSNQIGLPTPGGMYSEGAIIQNNIIEKYSSGTMKFAGGMTGGTNSMIGEAGKEAVVDLNSRSARSMFNAKPSATPEGESDPGMQASGASTLAVVDQFIKGMGPLGAPVAQALGPDISNLARTFGMSQTLPNIKVGGGRFREDAGAKKTRDKFLENLIAGSLEALGAKKKEEKTEETTPPPTPPPNPGPTGDKPDNEKNSPTGKDKPMDDHGNKPPAEVRGHQWSPNMSQERRKSIETSEETGKTKDPNRIILDIPGHPDYQVHSNRANGDFEIWKKGWFLGIGSKPKITGNATDKNTGKYKDPLFAAAYNEVRANYLSEAATTGVQMGYLTQAEWQKKEDKDSKAKTRGNQQKGGTIKPSMKEGGAVKKPWWDFLGWVTGMKSVEQGKTGIYSDAPMGRLADRTANTNKAIQEMMGRNYEQGGSVKQSSMRDDVSDIRRMITASQMRQQGRNLLGTDKEFPGQPAVVGDDLIPKPTASAAAPRSSPATSAPTPTAQSFDGLDTATIINLYQQSGPAPVIPVSNDEGQSTSSYVGDAFGSGIAFSVLTINPWGN